MMDEQEAAACIGKEAFATGAKAWAMLKKKRPGHHMKAGRAPYRCKFCHQWHLGVSDRKDLERR